MRDEEIEAIEARAAALFAAADAVNSEVAPSVVSEADNDAIDALSDAAAAARTDVVELVAEVKALRAVVAECEWISYGAFCPVCECHVEYGHAPTCALAAALGR